jgi:hypothetical protein
MSMNLILYHQSGSILRMVTAGVLGGMLYIMMLTERRFRPDSPRIFSIRAVLIPFIKKLIEDIQDGYMNDVFEEPMIKLYHDFSVFGLGGECKCIHINSIVFL